MTRTTSGTGWRLWRCGLALLVLGGLLALLFVPLPTVRGPGGEEVALRPEGRVSLAIVVLALVLWITEAIPPAATALGLFPLFALSGVTSLDAVVRAGLGHPLVLFFLSLMVLAAGFVEVGLSRRVADQILLRSKGHADRMVFLTLAAGVLLAMGVTALAATSVLVSMCAGILEQSGLHGKQSNLGRALLLATCWGPIIGSLGTPAGAGSNMLAIAYLRDLAGRELTFSTWVALGLPIALLLVPVAWLILHLSFPTQQEALLPAEALPHLQTQARAPLSRREWAFLAVFLTAAALWILGPSITAVTRGRVALSFESVGLAAAVILLLPVVGTLSWHGAERGIRWSVLLVLAAGLACGAMLYESGAARWMAWILLGPLTTMGPVGRVLIEVGAVLCLRLLFSTASSATAILLPLIISLAGDLGADAWLFTAAAVFAINIAFILPIQSACNLISHATGYFSAKDMIKGGVPLTLVGGAVIVAVVLLAIRLSGVP